MMEEPPTDEYYDALRKDMGHRHPKACSHLLDHLVSLEAFLDKSILFWFSGRKRSALLKGSSWAILSGGTGARRTRNGARRSPISRL